MNLTNSNTALIVGGTGMLAAATRYVVDRVDSTTIVSRNPASAKSIGLDIGLTCIADWRHFEQFATALSLTFAARRPTLAVLWIHSDGAQALAWLLEQLGSISAFVIHVRSATAPVTPSYTGAVAQANYVSVRLGSKCCTDGRRRWLTHEEISAGTIKAIRLRRDIIVGDPVGLH